MGHEGQRERGVKDDSGDSSLHDFKVRDAIRKEIRSPGPFGHGLFKVNYFGIGSSRLRLQQVGMKSRTPEGQN